MVNSRDIDDLVPDAKAACAQFISDCLDAGITIKIIQTLRDAQYQASLYAQGRTVTGKVRTNCDGYHNISKHQSGKAWDAVPLDGKGEIIWSNTTGIYEQMAEIAEARGLTAGIRWKSIGDMDHFQLSV